jgi:hypothetical protein
MKKNEKNENPNILILTPTPKNIYIIKDINELIRENTKFNITKDMNNNNIVAVVASLMFITVIWSI